MKVLYINKTHQLNINFASFPSRLHMKYIYIHMLYIGTISIIYIYATDNAYILIYVHMLCVCLFSLRASPPLSFLVLHECYCYIFLELCNRLEYIQSSFSSIQHSALHRVGFPLIILKIKFIIFYSINKLSWGGGNNSL